MAQAPAGSPNATGRGRRLRIRPAEPHLRWARPDACPPATPPSWSGASSTDDDGATIVWRGNAAAVAVIGPTGATRGRIDITWDGGIERIDLGRDEYTPRTLLFTTNWHGPAERQIAIAANRVGSRRTVAVDDIVVLTYSLSPQPGA